MDSIIGRMVYMVLVLIGLAGVGALAYQAFGSNKASAMTSGTQNLVTSINQVFLGVPTFTGLKDVKAVQIKTSSNMWSSNNPGAATIGTAGTLIDPWGNDLQVLGGGDNGIPAGVTASKAQFVLHDAGTNLNTTDCVSVLNAISPLSFATYVDGNVVGTPGSPLSAPQVLNACATDGLAIDWVFGH